MKFIENLKIRDKLLLLLFLLLLPLAFFVYKAVSREIMENQELESVALDLNESELISSLIYEFQKERARIITAAESDSAYKIEAQAQRIYTDGAEKALKSFLVRNNRALADISLLDDLDRYRSQLDQNRLELQDFRQYSIQVINRLLHRIDENATGVSNVQISRELISFKYLVEAKVHLGRMRSQLLRALHAENFSYNEYAFFSTQRFMHASALDGFSRYASEQAYQNIKQLTDSKDYNSIRGLFLKFDQNPQLNLRSFRTNDIYGLFTRAIEDFNTVESSLITTIRKQVEEESASKNSSLSFFIGLLILVLGLATLLSFYIISLISRSLIKLKNASDLIRLGATDVVVDVNSSDEIGEVAESFRGVVSKNIALTKVAQAIGSGNYAVEVDVYSKEDSLSNAIKEMKENLQFYTRESTNRSWVMAGIAELNNLIATETNLEGLTKKVVSFLSEYTGSEAGVLYLHDNSGKLRPAASYGIKVNLEKLITFPLGTGKVGQAVSEKRVKILENVTNEHLKLETGLAEITPSTVIILPLNFTDTIIGALELSARHAYSDLELEFFKIASERVSILIHTLSTYVRTQELLYETQNQAEELETQQEELRQLNAELKASEEELKVSQEELQEKNSELEEKAQLLEEQFEAVRTKNQALEDARQAIELKMQQVETVSKYKSDFLANMSHELRTPLNSILILSRLLADNTDQNLSAKQTEHASIIHKSGADLLKLINEILDLSKIESGQIRLEIEEVNIRKLAIQDTFEELASSKGISFSVTVEEKMVDTIKTDRFRLEQILRNFLSNAIKFTPEGGRVELSVFQLRERKNFNSEYLNQQNDLVAFAVRDTGIGISPEKQELVFEAFQQADTSTTRKYGGTGLGLTISRELASLLGGEIELKSEEGKGSTFTLYLPLTLEQENAAPLPAMTKNDHARNQQKENTKQAAASYPRKEDPIKRVLNEMGNKQNKETTLLIIEDDKGFNELLADFSLAKNFVVHQAYTGQEGLRLAHETKPDAILLDINLPDISGWEVLKQIREIKDLRHVNVHVMSAYDREVVDTHQDNEEYLPKPVTLEMLNKAFTTIGEASQRSIENILIVEDNEIENHAIAELLLSHNLKSVSAYTAEEAERVLSRQKIDCIILDINLPDIKGNVWMESIRAKKGLQDIPIIIYSGKDLSETEEARLKQFANTIIIKNEYSYIRLLDEVQLFLHKVNQKLPTSHEFKMKLHVPEEILKNKKALVVDDDVRNVYSLCSLMELQGMDLVVAYDGKEAIEKLETETGIDIVLMDVMMPEMDGIEAIKHIRQNYQFKKLPIIALTAKAMKGDKEKCLEAGASDYITKPVDTEKLLTLMRVWLYEA